MSENDHCLVMYVRTANTPDKMPSYVWSTKYRGKNIYDINPDHYRSQERLLELTDTYLEDWHYVGRDQHARAMFVAPQKHLPELPPAEQIRQKAFLNPDLGDKYLQEHDEDWWQGQLSYYSAHADYCTSVTKLAKFALSVLSQPEEEQ